jgi:hypothetical protein
MSRYDDDAEVPVKTAPRKRYEDDEEVEAPKKKALHIDEDDDELPAPKTGARVIRSGWGAVEQAKSSDSQFAQRLKIGEDPVIVKFLEDEPYATYRQHWLERQGQKSFTCIADIDPSGDCPLCKSGNRPSTRFAFNVVLLSSDLEPMVKSYEVGPRVIDQLKNFHTDPRQGPLSKHFWAVSRSGKGATSSTNHQLVKERDLDEWGIDPLDERDFKVLFKQAYTPDIIQIPSRKDLMKIVIEELSD